MMVLRDTAFHAPEGESSRLKVCPRGAWQNRLLVESVLVILTLVMPFKKVVPRCSASFHARLACTMAVFNVLVQWHG